MRPRTLLVMLVVILALGGFIFFYEKDLPSTEERVELDKRMMALESADVDALEIVWQGNRVRLERHRPAEGAGGEELLTDSGWRLIEPLEARADASAIESLLISLTGLEKERILEDVDEADVGLDEPEVEVTLVTEDGEEVLKVGPEIPASSDRIVAVGRRVYQVAGTFADRLTREPGEWRDKKVFPATRAGIERIRLDAGDREILLARRGEEFWIESPLSDRADEERVEELLTEITALRVREFVGEASLDLSTFGLEPPQGVVEVVLEGEEEPFRLELGQPSEDGVVHGRAEDQVFEIETELDETLARAPGEWRSRSWTGLEVFKIDSARVEDGEGSVEVNRDGADWTRGGERVDYTAASDFLYAIADARADEAIERAEAKSRGYRFEDPLLTFRLGTADGEEELVLYPPVEGLAAATSDGRDAVLLLPSSTVDEIRAKIDALRSAETLPDLDRSSPVPDP